MQPCADWSVELLNAAQRNGKPVPLADSPKTLSALGVDNHMETPNPNLRGIALCASTQRPTGHLRPGAYCYRTHRSVWQGGNRVISESEIIALVFGNMTCLKAPTQVPPSLGGLVMRSSPIPERGQVPRRVGEAVLSIELAA